MGFFLLTIFFLSISISGTLVVKRLFKFSNKLLLLSSGMLVGTLGLLLIGGTLGYIFKGRFLLTLLFLSYLTISIKFGLRELKISRGFLTRYLSFNNLLLGSIIFVYIYYFFLTASSFELGGDVDVYFGIATSFANGNYPSYLPWQSHFLTSYHMGAFIVEGIVHGITKVPIYSVHVFFSAFIITTLFLLILGIAKERLNSLLVLIPALLGVITFAGPIILTSGFANFIVDPLNSSYPQFVDFKGSLGSGTADLFGMFYRNFYPFALATFIFSIYLLAKYQWEKGINELRKKYILLTILLALILSIDESYFIILGLITVIYFVKDFYNKTFFETVKILGQTLIIFITLFLLIQNSVRDALFNPSLESSRFKLLLPGGEHKSQSPEKFTLIPGDQEFMQYLNHYEESGGNKAIGKIPGWYFLKNFEQINGGTKVINNTTWVLPNIFIVGILTFILSLILRSTFAGLLSFCALVTLLLSQIISYTFFPPTSIRFIHQSAQLTILAIGFLILSLFQSQLNQKAKYLFLIIVFLIIGPHLITSNINFFSYYSKHSQFNFFGQWRSPYNQTFNNIREHINVNDNILFLDSFPLDSGSSGIVSDALARFGFFIPVAPTGVKVVSPEASSEYLDATLSLNPPTLKQLNIEYIFVQPSALARLEKFKVDINNPEYFQFLERDNAGVLYKVRPAYLNLPNQPHSLNQFINDVPKGKTIYLDQFKLVEVRRGLVLRLAKDTKLIGPGFSAGWDYFLYIETFLPFTYICRAPYLPECSPEITRNYDPVDYLITSPDKDIREISDQEFRRVNETPLVVLWERVRS